MDCGLLEIKRTFLAENQWKGIPKKSTSVVSAFLTWLMTSILEVLVRVLCSVAAKHVAESTVEF